MAKISAMGKIYGNRMYYSGWSAEDVPEKWRKDAELYYEELTKNEEN